MIMAPNINDTKRTLDVKIKEDISFDRMFLSTRTLSGLNSAGFFRPSPVQLQGIPLGKCGFDLLLEAKSGTGKTLVFGVTALEQLDLEEHTQVLILAPTREIAAQITDVLMQIGMFFEGLKVEMVIGGLSVRDDFKKFTTCQRTQIVVGTPGRMRHLVELGYIDVSKIKLIVLDEADKLMEQSFQKDVNFVFNSLPVSAQVIMSSATYPEKLKKFALNYLKHPQHIRPNTTNILLGISQKILQVESHSNVMKQTENKFKALIRILTSIKFKQCLIFCNYQARVTEISKKLRKAKWPVETLYGCQEQNERLEALKTLQNFECRILVSSDLASRGLDAANVDLVINFEPPSEWTTYLHRIGRAGRFGSYGTAVTILAKGSETKKFKQALSILKAHLELKFYDNSEQFEIDETIPNLSEKIEGIKKNNGNIDLKYAHQDSDGSLNSRFDSSSEAIPNNINLKEIWFKDKSLDQNLQVEQFNTLLTSYQEFGDDSKDTKQKDLPHETGNNHNTTNSLVDNPPSFDTKISDYKEHPYSCDSKKSSNVKNCQNNCLSVESVDTDVASTSKLANGLETRPVAQNDSDDDRDENALNFNLQRNYNTSSDDEDCFKSPFPYYYKKYNDNKTFSDTKKIKNTNKKKKAQENYKHTKDVDRMGLKGSKIYDSDIENKYHNLVNERSKYDPDVERKYEKLVHDSLNYYYSTRKVAQSTCEFSQGRRERNVNEVEDIVNEGWHEALPNAASYQTWYKNLKAKSKQIQMSVYISELSKLENYDWINEDMD